MQHSRCTILCVAQGVSNIGKGTSDDGARFRWGNERIYSRSTINCAKAIAASITEEWPHCTSPKPFIRRSHNVVFRSLTFESRERNHSKLTAIFDSISQRVHHFRGCTFQKRIENRCLLQLFITGEFRMGKHLEEGLSLKTVWPDEPSTSSYSVCVSRSNDPSFPEAAPLLSDMWTLSEALLLLQPIIIIMLHWM